MWDVEECDMATTKVIPLCPTCAGYIGGACGGPDCEWRPALDGETCGAFDHKPDQDEYVDGRDEPVREDTCHSCGLWVEVTVTNAGRICHACSHEHDERLARGDSSLDIPTPSSRKDVS